MLAWQALLSAVDDALFSRLWDRFFAGQLLALAYQPIANFVVQAALAAARAPEQVTRHVLGTLPPLAALSA